MEFSSPTWLWALLLLPAILAGELWLTRRDRGRTALLVARPLWGRVLQRPAETWRWVRLGLVLLGAAGLVLALAGPRWGIVREKIEREGVDVVMVVDTSGSMATADVQPSRFFLARAALASLLDRLDGDRVALVALEGEAYPLVPLTLDADAVALFLETLEPGAVPTPGTALGAGVEQALKMFVDEDRANKVIVLASDGEDLEGGLDSAIAAAKKAGVVIHTVGVGTSRGAPVPEFDADGKQVGYKRDESGTVVVSHLHEGTLRRMAQATGGSYVHVTGADTSLWEVAAAIDGMEKRTLAREYTYRKKERYQWPLGVGLAALLVGLLVPLRRLRRRAAEAAPAPVRSRAAALVLVGLLGTPAARAADTGAKVVDELLLRPQRLTATGRHEYHTGDFPKALESFSGAATSRPADPRTRFNLADALYKSGKLDEAAALYRALGNDPAAPLAVPSRFNLGNALFQKKDYAGAVQAYRDALQLAPGELDARKNLELALRRLEEQKEQQKRQQNQDDKSQAQKKEQQRQDERSRENEKKDRQQQASQPQRQRPETEQEKEQERFRQEAGMPKERAMQLLDALQQNEMAEQRKLLAQQRAGKKRARDW